MQRSARLAPLPQLAGQRPGQAQLIKVADGADAFEACLARGLGLLQGLRCERGQQAPGAHRLDGDLVRIDGVHEMPESDFSAM